MKARLRKMKERFPKRRIEFFLLLKISHSIPCHSIFPHRSVSNHASDGLKGEVLAKPKYIMIRCGICLTY